MMIIDFVVGIWHCLRMSVLQVFFFLLNSNILGAVCIITYNDNLTQLACHEFYAKV